MQCNSKCILKETFRTIETIRKLVLDLTLATFDFMIYKIDRITEFFKE